MARVTKPRLTVKEFAYYTMPGQQPVMADATFVRDLESSEQVWQRECIVGQKWEPLQLGWLTDASCVFIKNKTGVGLAVAMTDDMKEDMAARVIELNLGGGENPHLRVPPGESVRFSPSEVKNIRIRSMYGDVKYTLKVFPK